MSSINWWYTERGLFGLVSGVEILSRGVIRLEVVEAEVNNISIRFRDRKTGEPTRGKTKPENILQQLTTKKGQVYSVFQGKRDVETVLTMGIMEDVSIIPQPAGDTDKVDLIMNVVERPTGGFSAGGGISSGITSGPLSGLIGSSAYSHQNVFGGNQKLNISLERGQIDSIFHINYTDPWIEGDDRRTSRTIMVQHAGARDEKGNPVIKDFYSSPLTASGKSHDKILIAKVESVYTGSADQGLQCLFSMWNKDFLFCLSGYFLIRVTAYVRKCVEVGPACVLLSLSGGHVVGNFLPHEAFAMGGTNSVRGYAEGAVGSGRSYVVVSSEISFPMLGPVEGVIFSDYGTDLGSGPTVPVILLGQD